MTYSNTQLKEAKDTRETLMNAFRSVTLGHTRAQGYDYSKSYDEKVADLDHIKVLVHITTRINKQVIEQYFEEANDLETHFDIWDENNTPRTITDGYMHFVSDERMCEIMGFVPSQKQSVFSALRFW